MAFLHSPADVSRNIELWEAEIESLPMDKDRYEDQLVRLQKLLHPNHSLILDLKCTLCQLYGRENRGSEADMLVEARRKKELCLQVLETMDMVIPGSANKEISRPNISQALKPQNLPIHVFELH